MQLVRGIMLCKRTERERREEGESPENQNSADDQKDKLHPVGRQGAGRDRAFGGTFKARVLVPLALAERIC